MLFILCSLSSGFSLGPVVSSTHLHPGKTMGVIGPILDISNMVKHKYDV